MNSGYTLSVTQLNEYVGTLLQRDVLLQNLSVRGEISSFKRHSSGHVYFSLKDDGALVRCVMFKQNAYSLDFAPADGMQVQALGSVALYARDGQYQLYVKSMQREGEGELYRRFLMLKTRLEAQGMFDGVHKRQLPLLPRRIGVVTSPTGAVIKDIINVARRRFPGMDIVLYPVRVQGDGAAEEIAHAIGKMNSLEAADVLIVGRGGGSMEDLWAFNEEQVAQAIYQSSIPIVSAVGHETDFTIADFVADVRAPTPSAAAELCVPEYAQLAGQVKGLRDALRSEAERKLGTCREQVLGLLGSGALKEPKHMAGMLRQDVLRLQAHMQNAVRGRVVAAYGTCQTLQANLMALAPENVLKRGYTMVRTSGGYVGTAAELKKHGAAQLLMQDGTVNVIIEGGQNGKGKDNI